MCGIFGVISKLVVNKNDLDSLAKHAEQRGKDSSGLIYYDENRYDVVRADYSIEKLIRKVKPYNSSVVIGHSRLITNGLSDNQPIVYDNVILVHNGIVVNDAKIWENLTLTRKQQIDTEVIAAIAEEHIANNKDLEDLGDTVLSLCKGVVACALLVPKFGKIILFSNNGSLYVGYKGENILFSSEEFPLYQSGCESVKQVKSSVCLDVPTSNSKALISDDNRRKHNIIPDLILNKENVSLLEYNMPNIVRCSKCILPETMPFIKFDEQGICNYCKNYTIRNQPRPREELFRLVEPYRRKDVHDCIVPFSGGRDSCYGLHLIVDELKMNPITYTYDWGMVTDLARRNISRMCSQLGVENIIIAADIENKRKNITKNLKAWLKSPHLGMISILTAGDKHFFKHVESVKKQTGVNLNLWGINPLEVTHFKSGFLGVKPNFEEKKVYSHGAMKQLRYHALRFKAMSKSPAYFNKSLWDTLSGEYYRSFTKKEDYFHIFDYWQWDENTINNTLINSYDWETAVDTNSTWRIGDGTAGLYNYIYYTVAGFTEHDTFRSNQIREGIITRDTALELVKDENQPRYENIRWYLDVLGMDFKEVISIINNIPKLYEV